MPMEGFVAWSGCIMTGCKLAGCIMGFRSRLRSAVIQSAGALHLDELMLAGFRGGGFMHAVNLHGTPMAMLEIFARQLEWLRSRFTVVNPMGLGSFWEE